MTAKTLIIAQCTKEKRDGKHPAKELYMPSRLFRAQRRYAETFGDEWLILSARHGLVRPGTRLASYDETFDGEYHPDEIQQEAKNELFKSMAEQRLLSRVDEQIKPEDDIPPIGGTEWRVELICGEKYASRVEWYLDHYDIPYTKPFAGERLAARTESMVDAVRGERNQSLDAYASG